MNILIPTMPDDTHAIYVHLALESLGHKSCLMYTADFPSLQRQAFEFRNGNIIWSVAGADIEITKNEHFDLVWHRRPRKPNLPETLHPDDKKIAFRENMAFFQTIWNVIAPNAYWVNPVKSGATANCKLLQLKIAAEVGLNTPETIISNDPALIKKFIEKNKKGEVIYKPLFPPIWVNGKTVRLTYTDTIELADLPVAAILQMTPGIFQKKIHKDFELRITMMGNYPVAVKINSQHHPKGIMDWRHVPTQELPIEQFELPDEITKKCVALMNRLGLVFGCFDFIVNSQGEYVFLEINEQGQFLWIENLDPNITMLNSFVNFLINPKAIKPKKSSRSLAMADFTAEVFARRSKAMEEHVNPVDF